MMHVASKPDPSLMHKYRLPIKPIGFVVEDENEDLEKLSSDESAKQGEGSEEDD
jgi:hypothetical protein